MLFYPMGPAPRVVVRAFFGIATGFLEHFRAGGGGSVAIPGIHVLKGYISYCESFVLQSPYVGCLVAGVIS